MRGRALCLMSTPTPVKLWPAACPDQHGPIGRKRGGAGTRGACSLVGAGFSDEGARRVKFLERGIKLTDFNDLQCVETSAPRP